ncbi:methyltransferase domain-containing protein [Helicobacter ibis]|uniref:Tellurite resistance methyltransferase TehB-like domain-containing protein n=1 Tax=Helicobacter ibis TaxID=2962633 RepID=A0ABT4VEJ5_9HELI|nr:hypothetical protein [Helicobacter ibis]MDA3969128.1 hypothetical protein [Helicobacter ibis]
MNEFVEYYTKHKISPVAQDISDLNLHIKRRLRLYSALGISGVLFKGAKILEAGAGSGYNTLVFLLLGAKVDIVEPNETGRIKMQELFNKYCIDEELYQIHACCIEDFKSDVEYDFIIAEGFLPAFPKEYRSKIAKGLLEHLSDKSTLVTTTICEFSYFFEYLRILLSFVLQESYQISKFDDLVDIFCVAFKSHLNSLTHASRPIEEWVKDTLPNPTTEHFSYSLKDCIVELSSIYKILCGGGAIFALLVRILVLFQILVGIKIWIIHIKTQLKMNSIESDIFCCAINSKIV